MIRAGFVVFGVLCRSTDPRAKYNTIKAQKHLSMSRKGVREIHDYLSPLVAKLLAKPSPHPEDPVSLGIPWPYVTHDLVADRVSKELASPERTRNQLIYRLKRFLYPYPEGNRKKRTFYTHVRSLGLLEPLVAPLLLWDIQMAWFLQRHYEIERDLQRKQLSQLGFPLDFHKRMLHLLFAHLQRTTALAQQHHVPVQEWLREYHSEINKQLLLEAGQYFPQLRLWAKPADKLRVYSHAVGTQVEVYCAISAIFKKRKLKNNKLACQLTALICSSSARIRGGQLDPNPERVRKYVRDWRKKMRKSKLDKAYR